MMHAVDESELSLVQLGETLQMTSEHLQQISYSNPTNFQKLVEKAKRTIRREKAKQRQQGKGEETTITIQKKIKRKPKEEEPVEGDKKAIQMIRNRISAQNSRDRKKAYLQQLEQDAKNSLDENARLRSQLKELQDEQEALENKNKKIKDSLAIVQKFPHTTRVGQIGLALITLVSVFSIFGKQNEAATTLKPISLVPSAITPILMETNNKFTSSPIPTLEKSFSMVDTNTFFDEKIVLTSPMILEDDVESYLRDPIQESTYRHSMLDEDYLQLQS